MSPQKLTLRSYIIKYRYYLIIAMVAAMFASAIDGATVYGIKALTDTAISADNTKALILIAAAIVLANFIKLLVKFGQTILMRYVAFQYVMELRNILLGKLVRLSMSYLSNHSTGELLSRVTYDTGIMADALNVVTDIFSHATRVLVMVSLLFYFDYQLALMTFILYPFVIWFVVKIGKIIRGYSEEGQKRMGILTNTLQEIFAGVTVVKAFTREQYEEDRFKNANKRLTKIGLRQTWVAELNGPFLEFVGVLGMAVLLYFGGVRVMQGDISYGSLLAYVLALINILPSVRVLGAANARIQISFAAVDRINDVLSQAEESHLSLGSKTLDATNKGIEFRNVDFSYDGEVPVLKNLNMTINHGETVALVGPSGGGKTTIGNLLGMFYRPNSGDILIGGESILDCSIDSIRRNVGYVSQDNFLFNTTIAKNIAYSVGEANMDMDRVVDVAKKAYAHDFIMEFPDGYETVIGERGLRVSGGQRQRLTIARAMYSDFPILVLDEATSALDQESERVVQQAIDNLMGNRTTIVIAHRLSTIINASKIFVISNNHVEASGVHSELLKSCSLYKNLYESTASKEGA